MKTGRSFNHKFSHFPQDWSQVLLEDGLPQEVCVFCRDQLDLSITFKRQVLQADSMLRQQSTLQESSACSPAALITGDPLSVEDGAVPEPDGGKDVEDKAPAALDKIGAIETIQALVTEDTIKVGENPELEMKHPTVDETSDSKWDNITIKVEDDMVIAEPWPEDWHNLESEDSNFDTSKVKLENEVSETSGEMTKNEELESKGKKLNPPWCSNGSECTCQICQDNLPTNAQLKCGICGKMCETASQLKRHKSRHYDPLVKRFQCPKCDKSFPSINGLHAHGRYHPKELSKHNRRPKKENENNSLPQLKVISATEIDKQLEPSQIELQNSQGVRRSSRPSRAPDRHVVPHYSCNKCERIYTELAALENHQKTHMNVTFKCNHCGKKFPNKNLLEKHIQSTHLGKTKTRNRGHKCEVCDQIFQDRSLLFVHMRNHKSKVQLCEICGKTVSLNTYPQHKRAHMTAESGEVFSCDVCDKKFHSKMSLRAHKNSYHGILKYTCEVCGKQFSTMAVMKHHQHTHSGKRDHVCQVCGRAFTLKVTLKSHMRIHTGEMPYSCETCGRRFTWKTTYRHHVLTCKKDRPDENIKPIPIVDIPYFNTLFVPPSLPQELPIDYSEEAKYAVPINYSEETKFRPNEDTKYFIPSINEDIKHSGQPNDFTMDLKLYNRDSKSPA